jgi:branched-chain amino acid transport system substrate-binding protein
MQLQRRSPSRSVLSGAVIAAVALALTACGSSAGNSGSGSSSSSTYNVSITADLSGPDGGNGVAGVAGFTAAIKAIDNTGGVNGKKISLGTPVDAATTTDGAQSATREALSQNPIAIYANELYIGSAVPVLTQAQVTTLSLPSSDPLQIPPAPWFYSASLSSKQAGAAWVVQATRTLGSLSGKKIAIIHFDSADLALYTGVWTAGIKAAGGSVVADDAVPPTVASFTSQAAQIVSAKPDLVFVYDLASSTALEVQALVNAGYHGPIMAGDTVNDAATVAKFTAIDPRFSASRLYATATEGGALYAAARKYGYTGQVTSSYFTKGWALGYALAAGLKKCGANCTASSLPAAMQAAGAVNVPGDVAYGPLEYTAASHTLATAMEFVQWDATAGKAVAVGQPVPLN